MPPTGLVGVVEGTGAFVGLVVTGASATAYVCDGNRVGVWFSGTFDGTTATLRDPGGRTLIVQVGARASTGTVVLAGLGRRLVSLDAAKGQAGLFRDERSFVGENRVTGWVRLNDGRLKGVTSTTAVRVTKQLPDARVIAPSAPTTSPARSTPSSDMQVIGGDSVPCCPLPAARAIARQTTTTAVSRLPRRFPVSATALRALAHRLGLEADQQATLALGRLGLVDPRPSPAATSRLTAAGARMLADTKFRSAIGQLSSATPSSVGRTLRAAAAAAEAHTDPVKSSLPRSGRTIVISTRGRTRAVRKSTPATRPRDFTRTGPYTQIEEVEKEGVDPRYDHVSEDRFIVVAGSTSPDLVMDATAGFSSKVVATRANVLVVDLPRNAGAVEIDVYMNRNEYRESWACFGNSYDRVNEFEVLYDTGPNGTLDPATDQVVAGGWKLDFSAYSIPDPCFPPPHPDPTRFQLAPPDTLRFQVPAAGGRYVLAAGTEVSVRSFLNALTRVVVTSGIEKVVVRFV